MVENSDKKDGDSDVEEVPPSRESIDLSDDSTEDDICEVEHLRKLFIGGLAGQTGEDALRKFYSKWGTVVDTVVMRDPVTKRSRGFGFVTYSKVAMVDKAQAKRPHMIDGKTVESKRALPRPENQPTEGKKSISVKKIFVGGVRDCHDEKCLREYFSEFGNVVSVTLLTDNITGKRRGFALVEYDDYDAVDKAILQKTHLVSSILLDVKKSVYIKEETKKNSEKKRERPDTAAKIGGQYQSNANIPPGGPMADKSMRPKRPPVQPQPSTYQGQQSQQYPQQQYTPMPPYHQGPPPNYNQWGPSPGQKVQPQFAPPNSYPQQPPGHVPHQPPQPMQPQNYGGYSQAPMPPALPQPSQSGNWNNYNPAGGASSWNSFPPPSQPPMAGQTPAPTWQNNQWCPPPPSAGPQLPMQSANPAPPTNWQQPPTPQAAGPAPGMYQQPQHQQSVPPPPLPPNNFGNGYQQNYGGGPTKHSNTYTNRMNPYNAPPNQYNNNPAAQGYMTNGNRYRR